jgi:DNA ligase-1
LGELERFEERCLAEGYEGICFRTPNSPYKYGRSTPKEQYLVKMKRFETAEAIVVGVVEEMHNSNPAERNELGYQERPSNKRGMVGKGRVGALVCRPFDGNETFQIGSGFTQIQREQMWASLHSDGENPVIGKIVQYKHQPHGRKDKPRIPIFLGFRDPRDMSQLKSLEKQGKLL